MAMHQVPGGYVEGSRTEYQKTDVGTRVPVVSDYAATVPVVNPHAGQPVRIVEVFDSEGNEQVVPVEAMSLADFPPEIIAQARLDIRDPLDSKGVFNRMRELMAKREKSGQATRVNHQPPVPAPAAAPGSLPETISIITGVEAPLEGIPATPRPALASELALNFTTPPSRPMVRVEFDLGPGGRHVKRFHAVCAQGKRLDLIYDDRYEGDRFLPPPTTAESGAIRLRVYFDDDAPTDMSVYVPQDFNMQIGRLDILTFVIVDSAEGM